MNYRNPIVVGDVRFEGATSIRLVNMRDRKGASGTETYITKTLSDDDFVLRNYGNQDNIIATRPDLFSLMLLARTEFSMFAPKDALKEFAASVGGCAPIYSKAQYEEDFSEVYPSCVHFGKYAAWIYSSDDEENRFVIFFDHNRPDSIFKPFQVKHICEENAQEEKTYGFDDFESAINFVGGLGVTFPSHAVAAFADLIVGLRF